MISRTFSLALSTNAVFREKWQTPLKRGLGEDEKYSDFRVCGDVSSSHTQMFKESSGEHVLAFTVDCHPSFLPSGNCCTTLETNIAHGNYISPASRKSW